jgi:hypothetical protein
VSAPKKPLATKVRDGTVRLDDEDLIQALKSGRPIEGVSASQWSSLYARYVAALDRKRAAKLRVANQRKG